MFIYKVSTYKKNLKYRNYPKYIVFKTDSPTYDENSIYFYYVITGKNFSSNKKNGRLPVNLIAKTLNIDLINPSEKLNLSKLGTDYIFNRINIHLKKECIGSYPENYIFVNEPIWPEIKENVIDKTPLKRSYHQF